MLIVGNRRVITTNMLDIKLFNRGTANKNEVRIEKRTSDNNVYEMIELYFSYETIIGFRYQGNGECEREISENDWSKTTGKYLNELEPNHKRRIPHDRLLERLEARLSEF